MIPESTLTKIISQFDIPGHPDGLGPRFASALARHITHESLQAMRDEDAPESAMLLAACTVLTDYTKKGRDLEIYTNGIDGIVVGDTRLGVGSVETNIARALILYAENVARKASR